MKQRQGKVNRQGHANSNAARKQNKRVTVQVISGEFKGFVLEAPTFGKIHPMGERERLAIFNMVDCAGAAILELYAGTGAIGIEALSRGASAVTFVEKSREVTQLLQNNLARLEQKCYRSNLTQINQGQSDDEIMYSYQANLKQDAIENNANATASPSIKIYNSDVGKFLSQTPMHVFDLVFADPPYIEFEQNVSELCQTIAKAAKWLKPGGILILSSPSKMPMPILGELLEPIKTRVYAGARISLYERST